ncbi:MAG: Unknown protein [uncultured Sulfurovum sp.]|uniref:Uncharacterized protein n=1 Tax=uncultured Sulfurovum sp. TaxID=269237 RepID=A0A6S6U6T8_9BACT|nr:MAG: Unknown protein [uncultured Sulfurovum sp.]
MLKITTKLDNSIPIFERLAKIKKLFSSSVTFWTVVSPISLFILSQFIALAWNEKLSEIVRLFVKDAPEWVQFISELAISYFEKGADWFYVVGAFLLIFLFLVAKYLDREGVSKDDIEELKNNKSTENYLIQRIGQLEAQLLQANSSEEIERLVDEVSSLKLQLLALQIDDKVIDEAQGIIELEAKAGIPKALELIEKNNPKSQVEKLREQMEKQAKISRYKASLYEWIHQWEKAESAYEEAIEFAPNYDNYFGYAYFSQVYRADFKQADKFYRMALNKTESLSDRATILNNLGNFHSKDSTKRAEALAMYEEALEVRRVLAKENSKVYLPDVADSLNNLGNFHSKDSTKRAEALVMYEEALKIYRALAKENPKVYGRDCANTLVMGVYLFGANKMQLDEALELLEPYPDNYENVGGLRQIILELKEAR